MNEQIQDMEDFLRTMHDLEARISELVRSSNLTELQKQFILEHILVVPGANMKGNQKKSVST